MGSEALQRDAVLMDEIVERDPTSALYLPQAERLLRRGQVAEAIRLCEERRARPGRGVADHIVLGRCYLADGRLSEARQQFQSALDLDRENVVALKSLAGIQSHEGRHTEAADLYRAVCRVDPGDLESQTALHQITSGDFPEVRPPEIVVDTGASAWQPIRIAREEDHLPELALGLRTLESRDADLLQPSAVPGHAARPEDSVPPPPAPAPAEPLLSAEELELSSEFPTARAAEPAPREPERMDPPDAFGDRLGGLDVGGFQESALERLETALRPIPVRALGEVEPAAPPPGPPVPLPPPAAASALPSPEPAPSAPPSAPPLPRAATPEAGKPDVKGNRAAFETWLRNLESGS